MTENEKNLIKAKERLEFFLLSNGDNITKENKALTKIGQTP